MGKILKVIGGVCKDCKHYDYVDSKQYMNGMWWHWGYCYKIIDRDTKDEEEKEDLIDYFEVTEKDYCSKFTEKEEDD
jgi:hypothetical protein